MIWYWLQCQVCEYWVVFSISNDKMSSDFVFNVKCLYHMYYNCRLCTCKRGTSKTGVIYVVQWFPICLHVFLLDISLNTPFDFIWLYQEDITFNHSFSVYKTKCHGSFNLTKEASFPYTGYSIHCSRVVVFCYDSVRTDFVHILQRLCLLSGRTSYGKISWSLEAARFGIRICQSL